MTGRLRKEASAADISLIAIVFILLAQIGNIAVFHEANIQIYIDSHPSYWAELTYIGMGKGKSAPKIYDLKYTLIRDGKAIDCAFRQHVPRSALPIFIEKARVTPRNGVCENPYFTDYEYAPLLKIRVSLAMTCAASILLVISALKWRQQVMQALARQT